MNEVFHEELGKTLHIYLGDMNIGTNSSNLEEHIQPLNRIMETAKEKAIKFNEKKCSLFQKHLHIYGFYVDEQGIHTDPVMVRKIQDLKVPKSVKEVRMVLGLLGYYRRFVPHFATIA